MAWLHVWVSWGRCHWPIGWASSLSAGSVSEAPVQQGCENSPNHCAQARLFRADEGGLSWVEGVPLWRAQPAIFMPLLAKMLARVATPRKSLCWARFKLRGLMLGEAMITSMMSLSLSLWGRSHGWAPHSMVSPCLLLKPQACAAQQVGAHWQAVAPGQLSMP